MTKSKPLTTPAQTTTTDQKVKNAQLLSSLGVDLDAFMELLQTEDLALSGFVFAVSYTKSDNSEKGCFGMSGNLDKVLRIVDSGLLEIEKQRHKLAKDLNDSGGSVH